MEFRFTVLPSLSPVDLIKNDAGQVNLEGGLAVSDERRERTENTGTGEKGAEIFGYQLSEKQLWWVVAGLLVALVGLSAMTLGQTRSGRNSGAPSVEQPGSGMPEPAAPAAGGTESALSSTEQQVAADTALSEQAAALSQQAEAVLSTVAGAGEVKVQVYLAQSETLRYVREESVDRQETEERDAEGGTRSIEQENRSSSVVTGQSGTGGGPVVKSVEAPVIRGVVVMATGASDSTVKQRLVNAVSVLFDLRPGQMLVVPAEGGD